MSTLPLQDALINAVTHSENGFCDVQQPALRREHPVRIIPLCERSVSVTSELQPSPGLRTNQLLSQ